MLVKVAIAQINSTVGDIAGNRSKIAEFARRAAAQGADIVLTPELSLVGYPPEDLLLRQAVLQDGARFNAASVLRNGQIIGSYHKLELPNDSVFDEKRYFTSGEQALVVEVKGTRFGINICEDTWLPRAPALARAAGAQVLLVLNGSPYHMHKQSLRHEVMRSNVTSQGLPLVFANLVGGQDELIFDGNSFVMDAAGEVVATLAHAQEDLQVISFVGAVVQAGRR